MFDQPNEGWGREPDRGPAPLAVCRLQFMVFPDRQAGRPHCTLHHIADTGPLPYDTLDAALAAGSTVDMPAFTVGVGNVAGLHALHGQLADGMRKAGLAVKAPRLLPPVTPLCWTVREFVLVQSPIGFGRHVPLARWSLF
jgi:hypothetical protein